MSHSNFTSRMSNAHHRGGGFTLIECLLAAVVLAIFGAAMASTISQALTTNADAQNEQLAATYLDEVLTRIDAIGPATMATQGPFDGQIGGQFNWSADIQQQPDSDLYSVTVTITWQTPGGSRSVQAYTLLHDALGSRPVQLYWEDLS